MQFISSSPVRMVIMQTWANTLNAAVLLGIADMSIETMAAVNACLTSWMLLVAFFTESRRRPRTRRLPRK